MYKILLTKTIIYHDDSQHNPYDNWKYDRDWDEYKSVWKIPPNNHFCTSLSEYLEFLPMLLRQPQTKLDFHLKQWQYLHLISQNKSVLQKLRLPGPGFRVLDIGAGDGCAAEDLKNKHGASVYDNLSLTPSGSPFIDNEYLGDIDNFDFSILPNYDLIICACGGIYHGQRIQNHILELLPHLSNSGQFLTNFDMCDEKESVNIIAAYLRKQNYIIHHTKYLLYIKKPKKFQQIHEAE